MSMNRPRLATLAAVVFICLSHRHVLPAAAPDTNIKDVQFIADCDGTTQRYVVALPDSFDKSKAHDVLIALHGHGSDRWQFVKSPRDECRSARDVAAEHRMIFVSPDYRAKTSWMGPQAEADVVQIIAQLEEHYRVSKTFICGGSMGGTACLTFAAMHPELIDGVASMNGTANLLEYENFRLLARICGLIQHRKWPKSRFLLVFRAYREAANVVVEFRHRL